MCERFGYRMHEIGDIDAVHFWHLCAFVFERPAPYVEMVETRSNGDGRPGADSGRSVSSRQLPDGRTETTTTQVPGSLEELTAILDSVGK